MAWTATLTEMLEVLRDRGGYRRSTALTDPILTRFLNSGIAAVHDLICKVAPDFVVKSATLATVGGVATVNLPTDFYKLRSLRLVNGSDETRLRSYIIDDETMLGDDALWSVGTEFRYMVQAGTIRLVPVPGGVETLRLWYLPHATKLVNGGDTYDGLNGHEDLVYAHALRRCRLRDKQPTGDLDAEIKDLEKRLRFALEGRDQSEPDYLPDLGRWELA